MGDGKTEKERKKERKRERKKKERKKLKKEIEKGQKVRLSDVTKCRPLGGW